MLSIDGGQSADMFPPHSEIFPHMHGWYPGKSKHMHMLACLRAWHAGVAGRVVSELRQGTHSQTHIIAYYFSHIRLIMVLVMAAM
jgi:hypothetical protein